jgi:8-oxo-dGTP diphosphatase
MLHDVTNNRARRSALEAAIRDIAPVDDLEAEHRADSVEWVRSAAEIYRTRKPDVPPKHLVAYFAVVRRHRRPHPACRPHQGGTMAARGGHVEPDEDPRDTVTRELAEELGATAQLVADRSSNPLFVTQTTTVGANAGHVDVSLWYVVGASTGDRFEPDPGEFRSIRWWTFAEVQAAPPASLDPHLPRFVTKLQRDLAR